MPSDRRANLAPNLVPNLAPGAPCGVSARAARAQRVRSRGVSAALLLASFAFAACNGCDEGSISKGEQAVIQVLPSTVVFDRIALGDTQEEWVSVENIGDGVLEIDGWRWSGDGSEFQVQGLDQLTLRPGEEATVIITYAPVDAARDNATVIISSNAVNEADGRINLSSQGQSAQLQANPNPVVVNADRLNEPIDTTVTLFNIGSRPLDISAFRLETGLANFSLTALPASLPATIAPDGNITFGVRYEPSNGGEHSDRVIIDCTADNCEGGRYFVELMGTAATPYLVLRPPEIGFGTVEIGETVTAEVVATNEGVAPAVVDSTVLAPNPLDGDDEIAIVSIGGVPWDGVGAFELESSESTTIVVSYTPSDNANDSETMVVSSNDPEVPIQQVRLTGRAALPRLEVFPAVLEFGSVAAGFGPIERTVTIRNAGSAPLELDPLGFRDGSGAYTMVNDDRMPSTLAPDESFELRVRFDPPPEERVADTAFFGSVFVLPTNDPATSEAIVQLEGYRAAAPVCEIRVIPPTINFGTVPRGTRREGEARLRNVGSGPCEVRSAALERSLFDIVFSNYFDFVSITPRTPVTLAPGDEVVVVASYFPRTLTPLSETFGDAGSIEVQVRDPFGDPQVRCGTLPGGFSGSTRMCGVNLQARSAIAQIDVIPGRLDFGLVTLGCNSQRQNVRIYNTGTADVQVTGVRLDGCSSEFTLSGVPALPRSLARGAFIEVGMTYRPTNPGVDSCSLVVEGTTEGGGSIVVPVSGEGVTFSRTVDQFEQVSGRAVDVLFVVDNSGSMGEEQSNLSRNFASFISSAATWDSDFQLGVVTTQITGSVSDPTGGSRQPGQLIGNPRIVTPRTPSYSSAFQRNVRVGTGDPGSAESGLESARLALTDPNITDLSAPCDADCVEPYMCVAGTDGASRCGGYNRTFLRDDASLEIVFVSDEEDQSRATVEFFVDFFRNIKGVFNDALFHASAIVGPRGGCTSSNGDAEAGARYIAVAEATGGIVRSICDSEFSASLREIGNRAFGLRRSFALSRVADPATVRVYTLSSCSGGSRTPVTTRWRYERAANAVVWDAGAEPAAGSCFEVEYEAACF